MKQGIVAVFGRFLGLFLISLSEQQIQNENGNVKSHRPSHGNPQSKNDTPTIDFVSREWDGFSVGHKKFIGRAPG